jgi:prevent-host-death family protein
MESEDSVQSVGTRELHAHLSEYLRRASRGETILVTRHGKDLVIIRAAQGEHEGLRELLRSGRARWSGHGLGGPDERRR